MAVGLSACPGPVEDCLGNEVANDTHNYDSIFEGDDRPLCGAASRDLINVRSETGHHSSDHGRDSYSGHDAAGRSGHQHEPDHNRGEVD